MKDGDANIRAKEVIVIFVEEDRLVTSDDAQVFGPHCLKYAQRFSLC